MSDEWCIPEGSKVTETEARALVAGPYGVAAARFTMDCCLPLGWFDPGAQHVLLNSGTVTLVKPPSGRTFGITAAHVIRRYQEDVAKWPTLGASLGGADIGDLAKRIIDVRDELDLATIDLNDGLLAKVPSSWGTVFPLELWPPAPPMEDHGIMLGGYPARMRALRAPAQVTFVPWVVLSVARGVSDDQITWKFASEFLASTPAYPIPANEAFELGGASGGPVLRVGESPSGIVGFRLAGIISEARPEYECVIAKRADYVRGDGSIMPAPPR